MIKENKTENSLPFAFWFLRQFNEVLYSFWHNFAIQTDHDTPSRFITNGNIKKDLQANKSQI